MRRGGERGVRRVIAAEAGDEQARGTLLSEYLPLIYNIVGRALNGHADVDDVVQETMLRAVRGLRDLRDPAAFRSWLVAVAVRQLRDYCQAPKAAPLPHVGPSGGAGRDGPEGAIRVWRQRGAPRGGPVPGGAAARGPAADPGRRGRQ